MAGVISPLELRAAVDRVHRSAGVDVAKSGNKPLGRDVASWINDIRIELKCSVQSLPKDFQDLYKKVTRDQPSGIKEYKLDDVFQMLRDSAEKALGLAGSRN